MLSGLMYAGGFVAITLWVGFSFWLGGKVADTRRYGLATLVTVLLLFTPFIFIIGVFNG
jgi:hypothetical protein